MKKTVLLFGVLISTMYFAQNGGRVGINTPNPKATLDVAASAADLTRTDGFIAPRLTGEELKLKDALYTTEQTGAIVYAIAAANPTTAKTINVTEAGYFYFDGTVWVKINDGNTPMAKTEPWYVENTSTQATANTQNIYQRGNVGVGNFSAVKPISKLDVRGTVRAGNPHADEVSGVSVLGANSIAVGGNHLASGNYSSAFGYNNKATGNSSHAIGNSTTASGGNSFSGGVNTIASGDNSFSFGVNTESAAAGSFTTGFHNKAAGNYSVILGGNDSTTNSGSGVIVGGSKHLIEAASSSGTLIGGYENSLLGDSSFSTIISGNANKIIDSKFSIILTGPQNTIEAGTQRSIVLAGTRNKITGSANGSLVGGTESVSSGYNSLAYGYQTTASGDYSSSTGRGTTAASYTETVIGMNNEITTGTATNWQLTDPVLQVGIGPNPTTQKNAITVYKNGKVQLNQLKGTGNAYACIDTNGNLFRSATPCPIAIAP